MNKLKYVINTTSTYSRATNILIDSLVEDGVKQEDIILIYNQSKQSDMKQNSLKQWCVFLTLNLFEFGSILGIFKLILLNKDFLNYNYLLMHDTCKALKGFKEKSLKMNETLNEKSIDIHWAYHEGRHNIGIFSPKAIFYSTKYSIVPLLKNPKFDKTYAIKMEWDQVPESLHLRTNLKQVYTKDLTLWPVYTKSTMYSESFPRDIAYATSLNLIKYFINLGSISTNIGNRHPNKI